MKAENFHLSPLDKEIEEKISAILGVEKFDPDPNRLPRFYSYFKSLFEEKKIPLIIVGGTNGKGETTLIIEDLLIKNGFDPFLWSSPHILTARERICFAGSPISGEHFLKLFKENRDAANELTYYEFLFFLFLKFVEERLSESKMPVIIFEVGLGGRLDATNFFDCDYALLTNIARDHLDILGPTLKDVLREKIAIGRPGKHLLSTVSQPFLKDIAEKYCLDNKIRFLDLSVQENNAQLHFKESNFLLAKSFMIQFLADQGITTPCLDRPEKLWARPFEVTFGKGQFILVGSHNLDGLRSLAEWVNSEFTKIRDGEPAAFDEIWLALSRKDVDEIKSILKLVISSRCLGRKIRIFSFHHPRATPIELIDKTWKEIDQGNGRPIQFDGEWTKAFEESFESRKVLVTGSYYFVSELLISSPLHDSFLDSSNIS